MTRTFLRKWAARVALLAATAASASAQDIRTADYTSVSRAQASVRERILREQGGRDPVVTFYDDAQRYYISNTRYGVRGTGLFRRGGGFVGRDRDRRFSYEAVLNNRSNTVEDARYRFEENNDSDDGRANVPDWLRGTFRGRNPRSRRDVTVRINRRGDVTARYDDGAEDRGSYDGGVIRFGDELSWRVSQAGDGFDARDQNFGRRAERFRRTTRDDRDDDDNGPGRIPTWAVGVFRGTTDSGETELIIDQSGAVSTRSLTRNRLFNGTYDGDVLRFEFGSYRLERDGDGVRTVRIDNPNDRTSYRRVRNR